MLLRATLPLDGAESIQVSLDWSRAAVTPCCDLDWVLPYRAMAPETPGPCVNFAAWHGQCRRILPGFASTFPWGGSCTMNRPRTPAIQGVFTTPPFVAKIPMPTLRSLLRF